MVVVMLLAVLAVVAGTTPTVLLVQFGCFFILDGPFPSFRSLVALSLPFQKCDIDDDREQQLLAHHNNNGIRIINILGKL